MEICSKEELIDIEVGLETNNFKPVNELDLTESDEDSDNDNDYVAAEDDGDVQKYALEEGMIFADVHAFRAALKEYAIRKGFDIVRVKNEKARVTARCAAKGCPWRVHASPCDDDQVIYMVKKCGNVHRCSKVDKQKEADSTWIAEKLVPLLRKNRNMKVWDLRAKFEKYGISPAYMQLWRAKKKAVEMMHGNRKKMSSHELMKRTRALNALSLAKRSVKCSFCGSKGHNKRSCRKVKRTRASSNASLEQDDGMEEDVPLAEIFEGIKRERILDMKEEEDFRLGEVFEEIKKNRMAIVRDEAVIADIATEEGNNTMPLIALANQVLFQKQPNDDYFMEPGIKVYKRRSNNNVQEEPIVEENVPHEEALVVYHNFFQQQEEDNMQQQALAIQQDVSDDNMQEALPNVEVLEQEETDYNMMPAEEALIEYEDLLQSEKYMLPPPQEETLAAIQESDDRNDNVVVVPPQEETLATIESDNHNNNNVVVVPPQEETLAAIQESDDRNDNVVVVPPQEETLAAIQECDNHNNNNEVVVPPQEKTSAAIQESDNHNNNVVVVRAQDDALAIQDLLLQQHQSDQELLLLDPGVKVYKRRSRDWIDFY